MYVPTFQGLGVGDLVRRAGSTRPFPFNARHQVSFYRASNAIYHLFRTLALHQGRPTVLVPDYNSGNEIQALRAAGASLCYYPVGPDGQVDPAAIEHLCDRHRPDVLYVIHYLGWPQPMWDLTRICRQRGMFLVEDCALALLSELDGRPLGSFGDWSVYCLYKTLPVPNGAILVQNTIRLEALEHLPLRDATLASAAGRTAELLVQHARSRLDKAGALLETSKRLVGRAARTLEIRPTPVGNIGFSLSDTDIAMSLISAYVLSRLDFEGIRRQRVQNFRSLAEQLNAHPSVLHHDVRDEVCPLFFPLLVSDKPRAAQALRDCGIDALEFWNHGVVTSPAVTSPTSRFLRAHVLGLPIHQDLDARHMTYMARHVSELGLHASEPDVRVSA